MSIRRVVFNQKGGVGKSTITCNLAAISAQQGLRTLVLDLDVQGNTTNYLLGSSDIEPKLGLADFFEGTLAFKLGSKKLDECITRTPFARLDLLASSPALEELQTKLETRYKIFKLRDALMKLRHYDVIYIDTPPALNFYSRSALIAAERCLIPFDCDHFSRQALYTLLENVGEIREDHNDDLIIEGIVVNQYQAQAKLPQQLVDELCNEGHKVLNAKLSSSVKIRESHQKSLPMVHYLPKHKLTEEFSALHQELSS